MLICDLTVIGNRLLTIRKKAGMTQAEAAEKSNLSLRTYADIERGTVNMRMETIIHICEAFHITPDEILTSEESVSVKRQNELIERLNNCNEKDRDTALKLLDVFLKSLT